MSSLPNQATSPTGVRPRAPKGAATQQVRQSLHEHLRKTARFIKLMDTTVQIFAWIAAILILWLCACVIDHWLFALPVWGRWIFWFAAVAGTLWWLTRFVLPLLVRRINLTYAAQRIEHLVPEFKNGLVSWLQLEAMPEQGVPRGVMAALAYRAKRFIGGQDPSATVDTSPLIKLIGVVLLLTTLLVVYTIVSPKSVGATAQRILFPWASLAAPTRVKLLSIDPGAATVTQGKPLPVEVELRGLRSDESVLIRYSTTDGQIVNQSVALDTLIEGFKYAGNVTTAAGGVGHEFDYYVQAGDAESGPFRVSLSPLPSVVLDSVALKFPAYTRLPPRVISGGKVEAPEGTTATITARANQSMRQGTLEVNPEVDDRQELERAEQLISMQVDDRQLQATLRMLLNDEGQNPTEVNFRIRGYNKRGDANPRPILHSMSVLGDLHPEVTLVGPENRLLRVHPSSRVDLEVRASDPDFGLSQIKLEVRKGGTPIGETTLLDSPPGEIGRQVKSATLNMTKLRLNEGDRIQILAIALDNRHDPQSEELAPNRAVSEPLTLEIVGKNEPVDVPDKARESPPEQPEQSKESSAGQDQQSAAGDAGETGEAGSSADDAGQEKGESGSRDKTGSGQSGSDAGSSPSGTTAESDQQQSSKAGGSGSAQQSPDSSGGDGQSESGGQSSPGQSSTGQGDASQSGTGQSGTGQDTPGQGATQPSNEGPGSSAQGNSTLGGTDASSGQPPTGGSGNTQPNDAEVIDRVRRFMEEQSDKNPSSGENQPSTEPSQNGQGQQSPQPPDQPSGQENTQPTQDTDSAGQGTESASQGQSTGKQGNESGTESSDAAGQGQETGSQQSNSEAQDGQTQAGDSGSQGNPSGDQAQQSENQRTESGSQTQQSQNQSSESGSQESQAGDQGQQSANQGSESSSQNNQSGSQGGESGSQGSEPGSQGSESGSQSGESGSQGSESGSQGSQSGSQGSESSSQGSNAGSQSSQSSSQAGSEGSQSGSEGGQTGSVGDPSASQSNQSGGQGDQAGQQSEQSASQSDQAGSPGSEGQGSQSGSQSSEASKNESQASQSGSGESNSEAQAGQSGTQGSESGNQGSQSSSSQSSSGSSSAGAQNSSGPQGQGPPSMQNQPGKQGGPGASTGGATGGGAGSGAKGGQGSDAGSSDAVNQDYADRTTQLVLDELNRQREQPDPELLKELNWTEQDLNEFVDRWNKARDLAVQGDEQDRLKWQEQLRDLGLRRAAQGARAGSGVDDSFQQMQDSGTRSRPPESLRKSWDAFRRAVESR